MRVCFSNSYFPCLVSRGIFKWSTAASYPRFGLKSGGKPFICEKALGILFHCQFKKPNFQVAGPWRKPKLNHSTKWNSSKRSLESSFEYLQHGVHPSLRKTTHSLQNNKTFPVKFRQTWLCISIFFLFYRRKNSIILLESMETADVWEMCGLISE